MATLTFLTGFESGAAPSSQGAGLYHGVSGVPTIETSPVNTGNYSLKINSTGAGAVNVRRNTSGAGVQIGVSRVYIRIPTGAIPSATAACTGWQILTANSFAGITIASGSGNIRAVVGSGSSVNGPNAVLDTWHRIDLRLNITGTTWTLDWSVDGVAQTQAVWTSQATNDSISYHRLGSSSGTLVSTTFFDDWVLSETSADYPIGPGGTEYLAPNGNDTSNVGTNIMEEASGADCGVNSYQAVNSVPMGNVTNYIRQAANGNTNYVGMTLANISHSHTSIIAAMAFLAYTAASTSANKGGAIVSKDNFSSYSVIWGEQAATADYSDGSTSSLYWKSVIVAGANDDTTINALAVRLGYSDDASPMPYWIDVGVEVAYSTATSNNIDLDLVTYTSTINALTVLENERINLDLVTYTSTINALTFLENERTNLDLVTYTSSANDISVLENVAVPLDLVSYTSSANDISVLENVVVPLDLVSYTSSENDLTMLEHELVPLDLVSYSSSFDEIIVLENEAIPLDLVDYSSEVNDLSILESEIIPLDLVEYTSTFEQLSFLEPGDIDMEHVSYTYVVNDLTVLEHELILLEEVVYSSSINDMLLSESIPLYLDLVSFSMSMNDLVVLENERVNLDLVTYQYSVLAASLLLQIDLVKTPLTRSYAISAENRVYSINHEERTNTIDS